MTKPEEIVISDEDYRLFNEKQKYLTAKLLTYFMEHPVVFLGYSLSDPNIKAILSEISEMVSGDGDEVVNNIWFIEWKKEEIAADYKPASDRTVDLGNGRSIRINYLLINGYERVYESLYQNTTTPMDALRDLQNNVYNLIKSKSISDLEVDMVNIQNFTDEKALARSIGFKPAMENNHTKDEKISLLGVGTIADAEQLMTLYPMRISQVAERLGLSYWYYVDQIIKHIFVETGFNLKETNNRYHINIGIKQPEHRYSTEAVQLFEKVSKKEDYSIVNENGEELSPKKEG
ncbi:SIR2 family protein [Paenibacillus sp. JTLBN-2024]